MHIQIAKKLLPFCHLPGTACLIPCSQWQVEVFPSLLKFKNLISDKTHDILIDFVGPVLDFTVLLDLEKKSVWVFGHTQEGYRRYQIFMRQEEICVFFDKEKKEIVISTEEVFLKESFQIEKLSLGVEKKLDWELVKRRCDVKEILPILFRQGQLLVEQKEIFMPILFSKESIENYFQKLFLVGFKGVLVPSLEDTQYLGIPLILSEFFTTPLDLLIAVKNQIRALFFEEKEGYFLFLPMLGASFHAGRMCDITTKEGDEISFEWSKKLLKKVIIRAGKTREVSIQTQKVLSSFRLRSSMRDKGKRAGIKDPLFLEEGKTLYLDCFQK